ncbi:MAG: carboxypeptidase-like regulatory domain-containing protein [Planctomycetota bacterium]
MSPRRAAPTESPTLQRAGVAIGALVALLLLLALWLGDGLDPALQPDHGGAATVDAKALAPGPAAGGDAQEARDALTEPLPEPPPPEDLELDEPYRFALRVAVTDANGLPVEDAAVFVAPRRAAFGMVPDTTDPTGHVAFSCAGKARTLELWIAVMAYGTVEPLRFVTLEHDRPYTVAVVARGGPEPPTELRQLIVEHGLDEGLRKARRLAERRRWDHEIERRRTGKLTRRDELDLLCGRTLSRFFRETPCDECHSMGQLPGYGALQRARDLVPSLHPTARFADLTERMLAVEGRRERVQVLLQEEPARGDERLAQEFGTERLGRIHGVVRSPRGAPIEDAPVAWLAANGAVRQIARTDAEGRYSMRLPATGPCTLVAAAGGLGRDQALVMVPATGEMAQDFALRPERFVRGVATDATGAPLASWRVEFFGEPDAGAAMARTDGDGAFALSHLPRAGNCLLWAPDGDVQLPVLWSQMVLPDRTDVRLQLTEDLPARAQLRLQPKARRGPVAAHLGASELRLGGRRTRPPTPETEIRLLQLDTGVGTHMKPSSVDSTFAIEALPPGPYRGEVGMPGVGWIEFGPIHLDGRGLWDLGVLELPPPGRVHLRGVRDARSPLVGHHAFFLRRPDLDIQVDVEPQADGSVLLPPGDYVLLWVDAENTQHARAVHVESGGESELRY